MKPLTSSQTSRTAATPGSSSGSMPPPGTIHRSGWRLLLTSSTCGEQRQLMGTPSAPLQSPAEGQRLSLCLTHPQTRPTQGRALPLLASPSAPRTNSISSDTEALPRSVLLQPLPLPALMHCRKNCPCTSKHSLARGTASPTV